MPQRRGDGGQGGAGGILRGLRDLLARYERDGGGGGGGGGARDQSAGRRGGDRGRASSAQLARPGGAGGGALSRGRSAGGDAEGEGRRPQPGDWRCKGCGFSPNFARRTSCFSCRRPRSPRGALSGNGGGGGGGGHAASTSGGGGGGPKGPIGAGGSRPLLGRTGGGTAASGGGAAPRDAPCPPTHRVPGASVAARAIAAAGGAGAPAAAAEAAPGPSTRDTAGVSSSGTASAAAAGGARPNAGCGVVDADGFQQVRGRGWRKNRAPASQGDPMGEGADAGDGTTRGGGNQDGPATGEDGDGEEPRAPAPTDLRRAWQDEVAVVRQLKAQGLAPQHPAMRAATEARDSAEKAWREAKDPVPAPIRLARAQTRLDRAIELQGEAHAALLEYEQSHREKLAALRAKLQEARERVATRREQLEDIQGEVGAGAQGGRSAAVHGAAAAKEVHDTICGTVAPTIAALVEQLDTSTPAWSVLNGLLGTLSTSSTTLEKAFAHGRGAQRFDITDVAEGDAGDQQAEGGDTCSEWSESHELPAEGSAGRGGGAKGSATAVWATTTSNEPWHDTRDDCQMDTDGWGDDDGQDPYWGTASRWEACGHGKWTRSSTDWADSWEREHGRPSGAPEQPPAARRRLEPAPATPQGAGDKGEGGAPNDEARLIEQRKRQHAERLQLIIHAAIDAGVQPLTHAGEELQELDPHQLDAWVAEHLPESAVARS